MAILQHTAQEIAVLDVVVDHAPEDLDGKTYAGFGYPNEVPTLQAVIKDDGGTGEFDDRDARHGGVRGAVRRSARTS